MKRIIFITIFLLNFIVVKAQVFSGIIKDAKTGEPLPYVNVGIVGKSLGTVTNTNGKFSIDLTNHDADSLLISMIGYRPQIFLIASLKNKAEQNIMLLPSNKVLNEVKISNKKWKKAVLGNTTKSQSITTGFNGDILGHEIGEIIKARRSPTWLKQFNASVVEIQADSMQLRLNIYSVKDGLPDKNISQQNIFITVKRGQKMINVNLEPYNIMVEDKFCISLECISKAHGGIWFSTSLLGNPTVSRATSQANWEKGGISGVGFNVLAEY